MEVTRIYDLLPYYKNKFKPKEDVLAGKEKGKWKKYSIDDYVDAADNISYALLHLGVQKGDKIATITQNRPDWNFLDMGILQIGAIHVPIYPTISESDYKYILKHAEVKFVFVAGKDILLKIEHIIDDIPSLKGLYTFNKTDKHPHLQELVALGAKNQEPHKVNQIKDGIKPGDTATLIYTSGTTGNPKGVMLSHDNMLSNVMALRNLFPVDESCRSLSYLPVSHVYERTVLYFYHYLGVSIYYAENMATIVDNMKEVKPEMFATVPRLLEKIFDKIIARGHKLDWLQRKIFFWAVHLANNYELEGKNWFYKINLKLVDRLVFSKWREALGGNLRIVVSGGAALQPRLARIFNAAKIGVLEGYGLTETSPVIAANNFEKGGHVFGTVGRPIEGVYVKIADDGEILVKGPNIMQGYFKDPEMTAEVIDKENWFHTGDLGRIEPEGHLKITGRKKALFKTAMGKYISPEHIENKFAESPFIDAILVTGENQKFAAALIVPDFNHLKDWCNEHNIPFNSEPEVIEYPEIKKQYNKEIRHINKDFGSYEQIKKYLLMDQEWTINSGELTANLKLRRNYICKKYEDKIKSLFA